MRPRLTILLLLGAAACVDLAAPEQFGARPAAMVPALQDAAPSSGAAGLPDAAVPSDAGFTLDAPQLDRTVPDSPLENPGPDRPADAAPGDVGQPDSAPRDTGGDAPRAPDAPPAFWGLVHHWKMDEIHGTTAEDEIGSNDGKLIGGATWTGSGFPGATFANPAAVVLDGNDAHLALDRDLGVTLGRTSTLSCWINTTQVGTDMFWRAPAIAGADQPGGDSDVFWGFIDAAGRMGVRAGGGPNAIGAKAINDGKWHHIAMIRDETNGRVEIFVDGQSAASATGPTGARSTPFTLLGRLDSPEAPGFKGSLDDVRVYNRVLGVPEVQSLHAGR